MSAAQATVAAPRLPIAIQPTITLPIEILLPMRLIIHNAGSRQLIITAATLDLPAPIVLWLHQSTQHQHLLDPSKSTTNQLFHL